MKKKEVAYVYVCGLSTRSTYYVRLWLRFDDDTDKIDGRWRWVSDLMGFVRERVMLGRI